MARFLLVTPLVISLASPAFADELMLMTDPKDTAEPAGFSAEQVSQMDESLQALLDHKELVQTLSCDGGDKGPIKFTHSNYQGYFVTVEDFYKKNQKLSHEIIEFTFDPGVFYDSWPGSQAPSTVYTIDVNTQTLYLNGVKIPKYSQDDDPGGIQLAYKPPPSLNPEYLKALDYLADFIDAFIGSSRANKSEKAEAARIGKIIDSMKKPGEPLTLGDAVYIDKNGDLALKPCAKGEKMRLVAGADRRRDDEGEPKKARRKKRG